MDGVTTAILVLLLLLAVGMIADQLFRLRDWLKSAPAPEATSGDEHVDDLADDRSDDAGDGPEGRGPRLE